MLSEKIILKKFMIITAAYIMKILLIFMKVL